MRKIKGKRVIFSLHASQRMQSRGISQENVLNTLEDPDIVLPVLDPGRKKHRKTLPNKSTIQVIFAETKKEIIVVTTTKDD